MIRRDGDGRPSRWVGPATLVTLLLLLPSPVATAAPVPVAYPPLPVAEGIAVLTGLSAPIVAAGGSGTLTGAVHDPLNGSLSALFVRLSVYSFEPSPGGSAVTAVPPGSPVALSDPNGSGGSLVLGLGDLAAGASEGFSVDVVTAGDAPAGAYAVRLSVAFVEAGVGYELESRGFFSASAWENATRLPGNRSTLNLTQLGVSGVVPETVVQVEPPAITPYLYGMLVGAFGLAAAGGYYATRARRKSSSGARSAAEESRAESAFGKSRTKDGD